ncbi:MAG TPA: exosortase/archaeosortase family protein [Candidatus Brocadiia bacterium]|nr:exosortase/archaeosortase family protein [Candidatus Brocadiales bacterium]
MDKFNYLKYGALLLFLIALGIPIFPDMFYQWIEDPDNSHCILIPFVSIFLGYRHAKIVKEEMIKPYGPGIIFLTISIFIYIISVAGEIALFARIAFVLILISLVIFNFGLDVVRRVYFPLGFLFFMIPTPVALYNIVAFPLQIFASKVSANVIYSLGIPVIREGNVLHLTNGSLEVVEACSGIRSLVSYITLGIFFVHFSRISLIKKILLLCSTVPLALMANIARISSSGILAHFCGYKVAEGFLHEFSGMAVFMLGIVLMLLLNALLSRISFTHVRLRRIER